MEDGPQDQAKVHAVGGYTEVARFLTAQRKMPVSRQLVWMWWSRRAKNGFPGGWERPTAGGGVRVFDFARVLEWHRDRYPDPPPAA